MKRSPKLAAMLAAVAVAVALAGGLYAGIVDQELVVTVSTNAASNATAQRYLQDGQIVGMFIDSVTNSCTQTVSVAVQPAPSTVSAITLYSVAGMISDVYSNFIETGMAVKSTDYVILTVSNTVEMTNKVRLVIRQSVE
jgi:hypothetical protein